MSVGLVGSEMCIRDSPKPSAPTSAVAIAVVMPINSPFLLISAPPLDPLVIGGSSGGALINKNGELIGITTAIATADVGAEGLGFAVPINLALNIAEDLIKDGKILHAFLGILGAQHFDTADDGARIFSGVYIQELYGPGGELFAIGKAGAQPGLSLIHI